MSEQEKAPGAPSRARHRLMGLVAVIAALLAVGHFSGLLDGMSPDSIRAFIEHAGSLGVLAFVGVFVIGQLLHIPGPVLIGAGVLAFGADLGGPLSWLAATVAVSVNFLLMRAVGGYALDHVHRPELKKWVHRLERRPLTTVLLMRLAFFTSPTISTAFAMSRVRFREHLAGSFLGMALPILAVAFLADGVLAHYVGG